MEAPSCVSGVRGSSVGRGKAGAARVLPREARLRLERQWALVWLSLSAVILADLLCCSLGLGWMVRTLADTNDKALQVIRGHNKLAAAR
jgi:hypothetical protein